MYAIVLTFHIIICLLLILVILMQQKGGGTSGIFGGGGESVFGGRGANPFLAKTTTVLFILFIVISVNLVIMTKGRQTTRESAIKKAVEKGEVTPNKTTQSPYEEE
ncbi:MAG: preprotein translocase subunit SecG [Candidatus Stahlbacteria bacterium]|nr:preprotein translocase subunit SecG [Candidatus Stahlbacteria bacterium]